MLPRANDDSAARLLLAEHAEECGDTRMARAWRWMAERAKWPDFTGWWPDDYQAYDECHRVPVNNHNHEVFAVMNGDECESAIADALERGDL